MTPSGPNAPPLGGPPPAPSKHAVRTGAVAVAALVFVVGGLAWAYHLPATALGVLLAFALADLLLFAFMKDVLVCYRCQARYRHAELGEDYPRFSLETAERYRQEAARLAESRRSPVRHATGSPS